MPVRRSCIAALVLCIAASAKADEAVSRGSVEVRFDARRRALLISDKEAGKLLDAGFARASVGGKELSTNAPAARLDVSADQAKCELTLAIAEGFRLRVRISENGAVELTPEGKPDGPVEFHATACLGSDAMPAILKDQTEEQDVLFTTLGNAAVPGAASLFAPEKDVALSVEGASPVAWVWREGWQLTAKAPAGKTLASIRIRRHYYRDELGIKYYAPIRKRTRWQTAPMVAMTWYGIKGWEGKPAQRKEWLYPQIDWVAEHLLPYAGTLVFQLDDNYLYNDDAYMRAISDYIRSKGLLPGIWFTPFTVPPKEVGQQHPDWFLHDAGGKLLMAFGGVNWNYGKAAPPC